MTIHVSTAGEAIIVFQDESEAEQFKVNVSDAVKVWKARPDPSAAPILMNLRFSTRPEGA